MTVLHECKILKTYQGYFAQLSVVADKANDRKPALLTPVLVVDTSGSMGHHAARLIKTVLPDVLTNLSYPPATPVYLITYHSTTKAQLLTVEGLRGLGRIEQGGTYMAPVPSTLLPILIPEKQTDPSPGFLIITISDGEIFDQELTLKNAETLAESIKGAPVGTIRSHAIRFDTGGQADTRALSSLLQLDNSGLPVELVSLHQRTADNECVKTIAEAVSDSGSTMTLSLTGSTLRRFPWAAEESTTLPVHEGQNTLWLTSLPSQMTIDGENVKMTVEDATLSRETFQRLLTKPFTSFLQRARVLKVVNTPTSLSEVSRMVDYFDGLERSWDVQESLLEESAPSAIHTTPLEKRKNRLKKHISKTATSLRNQFNAIMNDSKVGAMNSSQQAEYLRNVDMTKNTARGLARRGADSSGAFDFDETCRKEIRKMHENLSELEEIDDSNHLVSFYSRATTLEGIKTVCNLVDEEILDQCTTPQILELFNIVGIPVDAPVGDFPDPMSYRINKVFLDCYVSLSDVLVYRVESGGNDLETPGTRQPIVNVIPIFEDPRLVQFLRKHAPTMMEYLASVGMRRVVVDVSMTSGYSVLSAIWKMVEVLGRNGEDRSERAVRVFLHLIDQLPVVVGGYFAHTYSLLDCGVNAEEGRAYHLMNNGVTNMMVAVLKGLREGGLFFVEKMMRGLYTFEVWQAVRKRYRGSEVGAGEVERMTEGIWGVDFGKWRVPVTPLFEKDVEEGEVQEEWPDEFDEGYVGELLKDCWYVDFLTYIPKLFSIAVQTDIDEDEKVSLIKNLPPFDDSVKASVLGVESLKEFTECCLVQALVYTTKKMRVDEETGLPLLPDPGHKQGREELYRKTLREVYLRRWREDLKEKTREEDRVLGEMLRDALVEAQTVDEFVRVLREGVQKGTRTSCLKGPSDEVFKVVEAAFFVKVEDGTEKIPLHAEKLATLITASLPFESIPEPLP
ncbi:hypothetical protein HK097_003894, partial [Rhizophlyctis rosea]